MPCLLKTKLTRGDWLALAVPVLASDCLQRREKRVHCNARLGVGSPTCRGALEQRIEMEVSRHSARDAVLAERALTRKAQVLEQAY